MAGAEAFLDNITPLGSDYRTIRKDHYGEVGPSMHHPPPISRLEALPDPEGSGGNESEPSAILLGSVCAFGVTGSGTRQRACKLSKKRYLLS